MKWSVQENEDIENKRKALELLNEINKLLGKETKYNDNIYDPKNIYKHYECNRLEQIASIAQLNTNAKTHQTVATATTLEELKQEKLELENSVKESLNSPKEEKI